jgi:C-methyltransferase C-terminal domain/Putative zinc binding domain/Methyltransferase domain
MLSNTFPLTSEPMSQQPPACRFCRTPLRHTFVDLGMSPLCESYLSSRELNRMEPFYPLHVYVCGECFLVQLEAYVSAEHIFNEYAYFSSYSSSWVDHARVYAEQMVERFQLGPRHQVVEIGSNDGYLLQHFVANGIPAHGVEPAANVAEVALDRGIPTLVKFFGRSTAREMTPGLQADLLVGNNVLAQVPDLNDFVAGMKLLLKPRGVITLEFPHLTKLMQENQFDTIYHEHFSYFSLTTATRVLEAHGLTVFDVEELPTHGGSLRVYARHKEDTLRFVTGSVVELLEREKASGVDRMEYYASFAERVRETKRLLLTFLIDAKRAGKSIAGYGAPGKGNTLLNYCGIRADFLDYTVDKNPHKQGKFLPGTHIPIYHPDRIAETKPDYVLILPWNLRTEIMQQMAAIRQWHGRFVVPIPAVKVY